MFITVCIYRARAGEEDAVVALHEDWQRTQRQKARGYVSGELLESIEHPRLFIGITRFESQEAAQAVTEDPDYVAWFRRVASLTEEEPALAGYHSAWDDNRGFAGTRGFARS